MEEQSHKSEMRAALQGDFERLRARRQSGGETADEQLAVSERADEGPAANEQAAPAMISVPAPARLSWRDRLRGLR